jgi:hypothetical protein
MSLTRGPSTPIGVSRTPSPRTHRPTYIHRAFLQTIALALARDLTFNLTLIPGKTKIEGALAYFQVPAERKVPEHKFKSGSQGKNQFVKQIRGPMIQVRGQNQAEPNRAKSS